MSFSLARAGDRVVDTSVVCVITRFGLRAPRFLLPTIRDYRAVLKEANQSRTPGLLRSAFLLEDASTCYSLSIWESLDSIAEFGSNVPGHVDAARSMFRRLAREPGNGPALWSTKWRLLSVSHNLNWDDFNLDRTIEESAADE